MGMAVALSLALAAARAPQLPLEPPLTPHQELKELRLQRRNGPATASSAPAFQQLIEDFRQLPTPDELERVHVGQFLCLYQYSLSLVQESIATLKSQPPGELRDAKLKFWAEEEAHLKSEVARWEAKLNRLSAR